MAANQKETLRYSMTSILVNPNITLAPPLLRFSSDSSGQYTGNGLLPLPGAVVPAL